MEKATTLKVTFKNVSNIGEFVKNSSWGGQNEIIEAKIYKVGDDFYKKCFPSFTKKGHIYKIDSCSQEYYELIEL